jgi:hypothetical protein
LNQKAAWWAAFVVLRWQLVHFDHLDGGACSDRVTPLFISCKSPARSVLVYDRFEIDFSLTADDC